MLLIVEFQPWGLHRFINIDQFELLNLIYPLEVINKILKQKIINAIEGSNNINALILQLDNIFLSYINKSTYNNHSEIIAKEIINKNGIISTKELSTKFNYSGRHLNRILRQSIGISSKPLSRLVKLNNAIKLIKNHNNNITQIAHITGFYDHSHFIHTFNEVCNITPMEYIKHMSNFYNEISKF